MGLTATLRRFKKERVQERPRQIVIETVLSFGRSLVVDWSPYGDPTLWKSPPPADYRAGNFQSSWFLSIGSASVEATTGTDQREVHHLDRLADFKLGETIYIANSAPHASSLEAGHSSQAPVGIMWAASEFSPMAATVTRRLK